MRCQCRYIRLHFDRVKECRYDAETVADSSTMKVRLSITFPCFRALNRILVQVEYPKRSWGYPRGEDVERCDVAQWEDQYCTAVGEKKATSRLATERRRKAHHTLVRRRKLISHALMNNRQTGDPMKPRKRSVCHRSSNLAHRNICSEPSWESNNPKDRRRPSYIQNAERRVCTTMPAG